MNILMFIVGFVIFSVYVAFLVWNIFHNHNKNGEQNYTDYYRRHKQPDVMDMDGMGNYGRVPNKKVKRGKKTKV